nr:putative disease resistance RPP13-like protein 1 [Ziziphus jujuba var. spinosa]
MEELGYKYFEELSSRSFFQNSSGGEKSCFVMHDLIHDLVQYMSRGHYFTLEDGNSEEVTMKVHHLVVTSHVSDQTLDSISKTTHLRILFPSSRNSFCSLSNKAVNDTVSKLTVLRVLNLSWCKTFKELPKKFGDLKHLHSLDLSNSLVERLPESVSKLYNLQILNLSSCQKLTQLPDDMHLLINLWHLDIAGCYKMEKMPRQIGKLKGLQTLTTFIVGEDGGARVRELGELSELRGNISLQNLENVANGEDTSKARFANKKKLEELTFSWRRDTEDPEHDKPVVEKLLSGVELKRLNIIGYGGMEFPNCFRNPNTISSIVSIKLERYRHSQSLPELGELPSLKTLHIKQLDGVVRVSKEFYRTKGKCEKTQEVPQTVGCNGEALERSGRKNETCVLPHSSGSSNSFLTKLQSTTLTHLEIKNCQVLESFPLCSFPNFTHLDLVACENLKDIKVVYGKPLPLGSLSIGGCPNFISFRGHRLKIESFPAAVLPPTLNGLLVDKCSTLTTNRREWHRQNSQLLNSLISEMNQMQDFTSFHETELNAPDLNALTVEHCENLKKLEGKFKDMIVKKCGGPPLVVETLGGLLHYKETEEEWEMILKSEILDFLHEDSKI